MTDSLPIGYNRLIGGDFILKMRIDKFLSNQGIASRKESKSFLKAGRVSVNGIPVLKGDIKIDPQVDRIEIDGALQNYQEHIYLMLNKPKGVVSATDDTRHTTVLDLVPKELFRQGMFPAGRLDKDTTGFVLLTEDGEFAHNILSPRHHVPKTYHAVIDQPIAELEIKQLENGIVLKDGTQCMKAKFTVIFPGETPTLEIIIQEGRYHQIKRMFGAVGKKVLELKRIKIGGLALDPNLPEGQCREISVEELERITNCNRY